MYDYRITKCLENGKVREYAIFSDELKKRPIETDNDGEKYFLISNRVHCDPDLEEFNCHGEEYKRKVFINTFTHREKDLVESILVGYADIITMTNLPFGIKLNNAIYYLNREYGEKKRKQMLLDLKNCNFAYEVVYANHVINNEGVVDIYANQNNFFVSVDKAIKFIDEKIDEAYNYSLKFVGRIFSDHNTELLDEINDFWDMHIDELIGLLFDDSITFKENSPLEFKYDDIKSWWRKRFIIKSIAILK